VRMISCNIALDRWRDLHPTLSFLNPAGNLINRPAHEVTTVFIIRFHADAGLTSAAHVPRGSAAADFPDAGPRRSRFSAFDRLLVRMRVRAQSICYAGRHNANVPGDS